MSAAQLLFFLLFLFLVLVTTSTSIRLFLLQLAVSGILAQTRLVVRADMIPGRSRGTVPKKPASLFLPNRKTIESLRLLSDHTSRSSALQSYSCGAGGVTRRFHNISTAACLRVCQACGHPNPRGLSRHQAISRARFDFG